VPPSAAKPIDANRVFYHYLQKELLESDVWLFQMLVSRLVVALGVWLHPDVYSTLPVSVPYAVRDPSSRGNKSLGLPDVWGAPDEAGYFRDDNSLVKGLPRSLTIDSASGLFKGRRIGQGFVAAHVWRVLNSGEFAARNPLTYSFTPNIVWLPSEVAALTDREGSFVQTYTQALSMKIYRHRALASPLADVANRAWALLPVPIGVPEQGLPDVTALNFFLPGTSWLTMRQQKIRLVADALGLVAAGKTPVTKVISDRYTQGLSSVPPKAAVALQKRLLALLP
jgi:hypothetical protein